jgi:hypothetical protein
MWISIAAVIEEMARPGRPSRFAHDPMPSIA